MTELTKEERTEKVKKMYEELDKELQDILAKYRAKKEADKEKETNIPTIDNS